MGFVNGVDFHQGRQAKFKAVTVQRAQFSIGQRTNDQQGEIGTMNPGFGELITSGQEILAEHRQLHPGPNGIQISQRSGESAFFREDGNRRGSPDLVAFGQSGRVFDGSQRPLRRAGSLHLGDHRDARSA